jgi:hypothetical protein
MKGTIEELLDARALEELRAIERLGHMMIDAMERGRALHVATARRLRREARAAAAWRGHRMARFSPLLPSTGRGGYSDAACTACGASVRIDTAPAPNSIDIGGDAVAVSCTGRAS